MANIKSAKKRIKVNKKQKQENRYFKSTVNTYVKKFRKLIAENKLEEAEQLLKETTSLIMSSASKGVFHKNTASRKVARLAKQLHVAKYGKQEVKKVEVKEEVQPVVEEVKQEVVAEVKEEKPAKKTTKKATEEKTEKKTTAKKTTKKEVEEKETKTATKKTTAKKSEEEPAKKTTTRKTTKKAE